jgi:protein gp37
MQEAKQHIFLLLTKRPERMRTILNNKYWLEKCPNVWPGVTVCTQDEADRKIPILLKIPAAVRFVSIEPMLSEIHLEQALIKGIDWVILGGETGPSARPIHSDWVRSVRDQCQNAGVPFFFKEWGSQVWGGRLLYGRTWEEMPK